MSCAAACGFSSEAVARAVARVAAKGDLASGLPAAAHVIMPSVLQLNSNMMLRQTPSYCSLTNLVFFPDIEECNLRVHLRSLPEITVPYAEFDYIERGIFNAGTLQDEFARSLRRSRKALHRSPDA